MGRILEAPMRRPYGMTLASRPRQLHDEDKSCGSQPAHIRMINRRLSLLMFCLTPYASNKESARPPKECEGFSGQADNSIYRFGVGML